MVLVIIGIIAGIAVPVMLTAADAWSLASRFQDNAVSSAMLVQNRMSREIRRLHNGTSVAVADAAQFSFVDLDNNPINYNLSGNILMRNSDGLADNVTALNFTYYDDNDAPIDNPIVSPDNTDIRRIEVRFAILAGTNTLNFQFQVRPQNLNSLNEKFN